MLTFLLVFTVCEEPMIGPTPNAPYCENTATVLGLDEISPLGFTGLELLELAEGTHQETFHYELDQDRDSSPLTFSIHHDGGEVRYITSEAIHLDSAGTAMDIDVECPDRVEIDVRVSLNTEDGLFDEAWEPLTLQGSSPDYARVQVSLDAFSGALELRDYASTDADEVQATVYVGFDDTGSYGDISGHASGTEDCDDSDETCASWVDLMPIGNWTASGAAHL